MYRPKKGDHVRVVLEGEVSYPLRGDGFMLNTNGIYPDQEHVVSVEKIEPPVEVFKPGDVVRGRATGYKFLITDDGYASLKGGSHYSGADTQEFTSKYYEKVNIE